MDISTTTISYVTKIEPYDDISIEHEDELIDAAVFIAQMEAGEAEYDIKLDVLKAPDGVVQHGEEPQELVKATYNVNVRVAHHRL